MHEICVFLCDRTGNAAVPWAAAGYECYCVDIKHPVRNETVKGNVHYVYGDVRSWVPPDKARIIFLAAFPPCTHLSASGAADYLRKGNMLLVDSLTLWQCCYQAACYSGAPFYVENPVGVLSHHMRKPDHIYNPSDYAGYLPEAQRGKEVYTKSTCLWVGNGFVMPRKKPITPVESIFPLKKKKSYINFMSPSPDRADKRAETPLGFSLACYEYNKVGRRRR
jgi:hypothetical protein